VSEEERVRIYLRFHCDNELARQFHDVKKQLGLKSNNEVLRLLIAEFWSLRKERKNLKNE
jgi:hypothetical protein